MDIRVHIDGADRMALKLKMMDTSTQNAIKTAMRQACGVVVREAKSILTNKVWVTRLGFSRGRHTNSKRRYPAGASVKGHVDTGTLRRSIQYKVGMPNMFTIEGVVGTDVPYGLWVEKHHAGGYLVPALISKEAEAIAIVQAAIKVAIQGASI